MLDTRYSVILRHSCGTRMEARDLFLATRSRNRRFSPDLGPSLVKPMGVCFFFTFPGFSLSLFLDDTGRLTLPAVSVGEVRKKI